MIASSERVLVKTKKLVEDLLSPISLSNQKRLSPYDMAEVRELTDRYVTITDKEISVLHDKVILSSEPDFDFFEARPSSRGFDTDSVGGRKYNYRSDEKNFHAIRLEDIDVQYVARYVSNLAHRYKKVIMEQERQNVKMTYDFYNDDGECESESDLINTIYSEEESAYDIEDKEEARKDVRLLLREIHNQSCVIGASLMSFIIDIAKQGRGTRYTDINKSRFTSGITYIMKKDGHIGSAINEAAGKVSSSRSTSPYLRAMDALYGEGNCKNEISDTVKRLMANCIILGVDLGKENPFDYQVEAIDKLTTVHMKNNSEYIRRGSSFYSEKVFDELYDGDTLDILFNPTTPQTIENLDPVGNQITYLLEVLSEKDLVVNEANSGNYITNVNVIATVLDVDNSSFYSDGTAKVTAFDDEDFLLRDSSNGVYVLDMSKYEAYLPKKRTSNLILFHLDGHAYLLGDSTIHTIGIFDLMSIAQEVLMGTSHETIITIANFLWKVL